MIHQRDKPAVNAESIERMLRHVAWCISEFDEVEFVPLMERLEEELLLYKATRDPIARARAIVEDYERRAIIDNEIAVKR